MSHKLWHTVFSIITWIMRHVMAPDMNHKNVLWHVARHNKSHSRCYDMSRHMSRNLSHTMSRDTSHIMSHTMSRGTSHIMSPEMYHHMSHTMYHNM